MARMTLQTVRATPNNPAGPAGQRGLSSRSHISTARVRGSSMGEDRHHHHHHARPDTARSAGRKGRRGLTATTRAAGASPKSKGAVRGRAGSSVNKSAFVRSLPSSLSAAEVIAKGKAKGIKLSAAQVYTIRANARRKAPEADAARILRGVRDTGKGRGRDNNREAEFVAAALDLGLARAEALIRALRTKATAGWS